MANYKALLNQVNTLIFDYDGVMTNGTIVLNSDGIPLRTANVKDGYVLQLAVRKGYRIAIISGGNTPSMKQRLSALGIQDVFLGVGNKIEVFNEYVKENKLDPAQIIYMGDDLPDYHVMSAVGIPVCPADAAEEIKKLSVYISHKKGHT